MKTASDIYSPVSGEVVEVNKAVVDNPALVNTDPYAGGWFFRIQIEPVASGDGRLDDCRSSKKAQVGG